MILDESCYKGGINLSAVYVSQYLALVDCLLFVLWTLKLFFCLFPCTSMSYM